MSRLNILYVEDHEIAKDAAKKALTYLDFINKVDTASNGEEALEYFLKNGDYDIVITDIKMPKKNGLDLIREIKNHKNVFSIVTTAHHDKNYLQQAIDNEVNKYLIKPINLMELVNVIKSHYKRKIKKIKREHAKEIKEVNSRLISLEEVIENISHQWRQPLNFISMQSSSLSIHNDLGLLSNDELRDGLQKINETTLKLSETLNNLNKIIQNSKDYNSDNLFKNIEELINLVKSENEDINLKFEINIEKCINLHTLWKDLTLVIKDLLTNSIDQFRIHKTNNPFIKIDAYRNENSTIIKVIDNGLGIDENIRPRIFEPYSTTKFKSNGKGLGLYLCYKIITELLNGSIYAHNENDGAVFTIKLKD